MRWRARRAAILAEYAKVPKRVVNGEVVYPSKAVEAQVDQLAEALATGVWAPLEKAAWCLKVLKSGAIKGSGPITVELLTHQLERLREQLQAALDAHDALQENASSPLVPEAAQQELDRSGVLVEQYGQEIAEIESQLAALVPELVGA